MRQWWMCEPVVRRSRSGWQAATPRDHPYRIAVSAVSEDEARARFAEALAAWAELRDLPA